MKMARVITLYPLQLVNAARWYTSLYLAKLRQQTVSIWDRKKIRDFQAVFPRLALLAIFFASIFFSIFTAKQETKINEINLYSQEICSWNNIVCPKLDLLMIIF